LRVTIIS